MEHINMVLSLDTKQYQAACTCGWTSTIGPPEEVDLLRAMHAHAVVTFESYR